MIFSSSEKNKMRKIWNQSMAIDKKRNTKINPFSHILEPFALIFIDIILFMFWIREVQRILRRISSLCRCARSEGISSEL